MAEQLNLEININNSDSSAKLGTLKKQLKEAQTEVQVLTDKFGATSKEAIEAAKRASELKDRIGDAKALTDAFNPDAKFKALTASLSGVAGGFSAVQGAIALFGVESEQVEKTLLKVQSAMALSQGLQSVGEAVDSFKNLGAVIKSTTAFKVLDNATTRVATIVTRTFGLAVDTTAFSFKALKVAIASTGIGILIVALGFVIEKMLTFANASEEATKKQKELNEQIAEGTAQGLADNQKVIDSETKLKLARAKLRGASEKELFDIEQEGIREKIRLREEAYEETLKRNGKAATEIAEQNVEANNQLELNEIDFQIKVNERIKQDAQKKKDEEERIYQENLKKKDAEHKERLKRLEQYAKEEIDIQAEIDNQKKEKEKTKFEEGYVITGEQQTAIANQATAHLNTMQKDQLDFNNAILDAEIILQEAKFQAVAGGLQLLAGLAGKNKAIADAIFIVDKALAIAKIVVDTQREIAGYASAYSPIIGGTAISIPLIAAAKIRAGASIATIAATTIGKFTTGSTAGFGGGAGTLGVAPIQPTQPTAQLTQLNQSSINAIGNQAIRAYVVETDVTSNQQRISAIKQRARFN
jgi:hypothetical protein